MQNRAVLDADTFTTVQPAGPNPFLIVGLCAAVVFIDGFDAQVMGFVAPALSAELHIARVTMGTVISSGTFGMMIGALVFGPLADRFGRRPVLIACVMTFGLGSLLTATATAVTALAAFRIFTGFGMGGAMPNAIALTFEYMPVRSRTSAVMIMFCGFALGSACAGLVAAAVIRQFGWQAVFLVGGLIPVFLAILLLALLPESIRFIAARGQRESRDSVRGLFAAGRARVTLALWTMFFMNLLNLWFLNNWLPTIMNDAGLEVEAASLVTALFQVGGVTGSLLLAGAWGRRISFGVLASIYLGAAVLILLIGEAGSSVPLLAIVVFASGIGIIGGQNVSNALTADYYPTPLRSTGVGWALGIGRVGSILGPILGGVLLSYAGGARRAFWAAAAPAVIAACAAFFVNLRVETGGPGGDAPLM